MDNNTYDGAHVVFYKDTCTDNKCEKYHVKTVLLVKRTLDAPIHPGLWALPGGQCNKGELPKVTAIREVTEEIMSIQVSRKKTDNDKLVDKVRISNNLNKSSLQNIQPLHTEDTKHKYFAKELKLNMDQLILRRKCLCSNKRRNKNNKVEGEGLGWFSEEEVHHMLIRPQDRKALMTFFSKSNR